MKGVILAAGKGSRLFPVTHKIPKPLLPLGGKMTLEYAFDQLKGMGITDIGLVVGDNEEAMRDALGDGSDFGIQLAYIRQPEAKGLAHAVGFAKSFVAGSDFVLYLGDAVYDQSFEKYVQAFKESGCANLNLVKPVDDPRRFGVANVEGDRIVKLVEKPAEPESNLAMAGMYIFGPEIWSVLPDLEPSARGEYEITDAIQMLIDRGLEVRAGVYDGAWFDTGTLDSFLETSSFLMGGGSVFGAGVSVDAAVGASAVVGECARVKCRILEDSVILPGADVQVSGHIYHSIVGGVVRHEGDLENAILWGE